MTFAITIDWYGPYNSVNAAKKAAKDTDTDRALYLAQGKRARQQRVTLQYVGVSNDVRNRFNNQHHTLSQLRNDGLGVWVGLVSSQAIPGRRVFGTPKQHSPAIRLAEWATAYFLELPLNNRKRRKAPPDSLILINRWFYTVLKNWERRKHRGHPDWPDLIEYDCEEGNATIVRFGTPGRLYLSKPQVSALAKS